MTSPMGISRGDFPEIPPPLLSLLPLRRHRPRVGGMVTARSYSGLAPPEVVL